MRFLSLFDMVTARSFQVWKEVVSSKDEADLLPMATANDSTDDEAHEAKSTPRGSNKDEANGAVRLVESADARQEETKQKEGESSTQKRRRQRKEAESRRRVHRGGVQKNVVLKPNQYNNRRQGHWSQRTNTEVSSCDWQSTTTISTSWYWVRH